MKEGGKLKILDPIWRNPNEDSDHERLESDCEVDEWQMEEQRSQNQSDGPKDAEYHWQDWYEVYRRSCGHGPAHPFQHIHRNWNQEADCLTHVARKKGSTWNSWRDGRRNAVWSCQEFLRCRSQRLIQWQEMTRSNLKWNQPFVVQIADRMEECTQKYVVGKLSRLQKVLLDDATSTQAECTTLRRQEPIAVWYGSEACILTRMKFDWRLEWELK